MYHNKYYTYSPEELKYKEVYKNKWQKYLQNYPLYLFGVFTGFILLWVLSLFFKTPEEYRLLKEKQVLQNEFDELSEKIEETEKLIEILSTKDDSLYRVILGVKPLPTSVKEAGQGGGGNKKKLNLGLNDKDMLNSVSEKVNHIHSKANVLNYSFEKLLEEAKKNKTKMKHMPAIMPINNKDLTHTGAGFGMRKHPILNITRMHEGIDFYAGKGTKVYATADGTIKSARHSTTFGNVITLDHGYGLETLYAHLTKFNVKSGQKVKRGEVIGFVGSTGLSSGPHLHYEVHLNNKEINPVHYFYGDLNPKEYEKIIELSEREVYSMD